MKSRLRFLGIIATVAMIGLSMTGCEMEEGDGTMRITISGFGEYNGRGATMTLRNVDTNVVAARGHGTVQIQNGTARFDMLTGIIGSAPFDTAGNYDVTLGIYDGWLRIATYVSSNTRIGLFTTIRPINLNRL